MVSYLCMQVIKVLISSRISVIQASSNPVAPSHLLIHHNQSWLIVFTSLVVFRGEDAGKITKLFRQKLPTETYPLLFFVERRPTILGYPQFNALTETSPENSASGRRMGSNKGPGSRTWSLTSLVSTRHGSLMQLPHFGSEPGTQIPTASTCSGNSTSG